MNRLWMFLVVGVVWISGCGGTGSRAEVRAGPGEVVLDIFSGRPNPSWALSAAETQLLADMIAALPATEPVSLPEPLGYRGFDVRWTGPELGSPLRVAAFRGVVVETVGDVIRYRADDGRRVERWLLETARPHIEGPVYDAVLAELSR